MMMEELNDVEIAALIAVRKKLKDGALHHAKDRREYDIIYYVEDNGRRWKTSRNFLDMNIVQGEFKCGSVACIGGWFLLELGRKIYTSTLFQFASARPRFYCLLYGDVVHGELFNKATPEQAVKAIDNYMFAPEGEPIWGHLLLTPAAEQATVTA